MTDFVFPDEFQTTCLLTSHKVSLDSSKAHSLLRRVLRPGNEGSSRGVLVGWRGAVGTLTHCFLPSSQEFVKSIPHKEVHAQ